MALQEDCTVYMQQVIKKCYLDFVKWSLLIAGSMDVICVRKHANVYPEE